MQDKESVKAHVVELKWGKINGYLGDGGMFADSLSSASVFKDWGMANEAVKTSKVYKYCEVNIKTVTISLED